MMRKRNIIGDSRIKFLGEVEEAIELTGCRIDVTRCNGATVAELVDKARGVAEQAWYDLFIIIGGI